MKKFLVLAAALLALAFTAQTAQAEPEHELVFGEITVEVHGGGTVTGTGINCGVDCYDDDSWYDNEIPPTNRLTATAGRGWAFGGWEGCTSVNGQSNKCDAGYQEFGGTPVIASFYDVMAPSVFLQFPALNTVANDTLHAAVESGDNDRVEKVEYLIDGQVAKTVDSGGIDVYIDVTGVSEGQHEIQARAYDPTGNYGITAARTFTVDHSGPDITLNAPLVATNADSPAFSFSTTATDIKNTWCAIVPKGDDVNYSACSPNEPFVGPGLAEGEWIFTVWATDNVGNLTQITHDFVVDRTAPVADFTSGPADGATVKPGEVTYGWSATDGLAVAQHCSWDGAEAVGCEGTASKNLAAGSHNFQVTIVDQAGNETTLSRSVTVKKATGPDPDPDPDP
ncbi:MAG TPA: Ig-like domain repeat protein, partial [Solirubrobacterales bacterium]|nr:Ig-like domain repeat protein [Solirubrobacterales bacterium]